MKDTELPTIKVDQFFIHDMQGCVRFTKECQAKMKDNPDPMRVFVMKHEDMLSLRAQDLYPIPDHIAAMKDYDMKEWDLRAPNIMLVKLGSKTIETTLMRVSCSSAKYLTEIPPPWYNRSDRRDP